MNYWEARLILSIQGNASPEEIKKAYAEKVKACNPETDPEGWMRLHEAYKLLLSLAESPKKSPPPPSGPETPTTTKKHREEPDKKSGEFNELFEHLDEYIEKEEKDKLDRLTSELDRKIKKLLFASKLFPVTKKRLTEFMNSPEYAAACRDAEFLPSLYPLFSAKRNRFTAKAAELMAEEIRCIIQELQLPWEKREKMNGFLKKLEESWSRWLSFSSILYFLGSGVFSLFPVNLKTTVTFLAYSIISLSLFISVQVPFFVPEKKRKEEMKNLAELFGFVVLISFLIFLTHDFWL